MRFAGGKQVAREHPNEYYVMACSGPSGSRAGSDVLAMMTRIPVGLITMTRDCLVKPERRIFQAHSVGAGCAYGVPRPQSAWRPSFAERGRRDRAINTNYIDGSIPEHQPEGWQRARTAFGGSMAT